MIILSLYSNKIMKITFGYAKDLLACFMFVLFAIIIYRYNINCNKNFVLLILFLALLTDGMFSLFPKLHNTEIKEEHFDQPFIDKPLVKSLYKSEYLPFYVVFIVLLSLCTLTSVFGFFVSPLNKLK